MERVYHTIKFVFLCGLLVSLPKESAFAATSACRTAIQVAVNKAYTTSPPAYVSITDFSECEGSVYGIQTGAVDILRSAISSKKIQIQSNLQQEQLKKQLAKLQAKKQVAVQEQKVKKPYQRPLGPFTGHYDGDGKLEYVGFTVNGVPQLATNLDDAIKLRNSYISEDRKQRTALEELQRKEAKQKKELEYEHQQKLLENAPKGQYFCIPAQRTNYTEKGVQILTGLATAFRIAGEPILGFVNERRAIKLAEKQSKRDFQIKQRVTEQGWPVFDEGGYNIDSGMSSSALLNSGLSGKGYGTGTRFITDATGRRIPVSTNGANVQVQGQVGQNINNILNSFQGLANTRVQLSAQGNNTNGIPSRYQTQLRSRGRFNQPFNGQNTALRQSTQVTIDPRTGRLIRIPTNFGIDGRTHSLPGVDIHGSTGAFNNPAHLQQMEYELRIRQQQLQQVQRQRSEEARRAQIEFQRVQEARQKALLQQQIRMELEQTLAQRRSQYQEDEIKLIRMFEAKFRAANQGQFRGDVSINSRINSQFRQIPSDVHFPGKASEQEGFQQRQRQQNNKFKQLRQNPDTFPRIDPSKLPTQ